MADSIWSTQRAAASAHIKQVLADGQEKSLETVVDSLKATGLTGKNALKALYTEVQNGTVILSGNWKNGKFKKGGA